jgi:rubredoxin---NAD+ reductase
MKKWLCIICGLIYDEALGWPDDGIAAGTRWEDVPQDWLCPECKVGKSDFEMIEISEPVKVAAVAPVVVKQAMADVSPAQPVVIIGSGHAGYGLAQALRKANPQLDVRVLTQDCGHIYSKPALSIALAQGRSAAALATESPMALEQRLGTLWRDDFIPIWARCSTASWYWPAGLRRCACPSKVVPMHC